MACIVTVAGLQAQAGKTTIAVNFAASLVLGGHTCLLIDLSANADASQWLGVAMTDSSLTAGALLAGRAAVQSIRLPTASGIDLVAGHPGLSQAVASADLSGDMLRAQLQRAAADYDFIFLDCPPRMGPVETAALAVADQVVIVCCAAHSTGQPPAALPRLQLAYITAPISVITNKVLPDAPPASGGNSGWGMKARDLGALRYVPDLQQGYWHGIPPIMRQAPQEGFRKDIQALAQSLTGS